MKTSLTAFILPLLVLFIAGCKKNDEFKTAPAVVKSITQTPSGNITTFAYDAQGRLTTKTNADGSNLVITYYGDTVIETYNKFGAIPAYTRILKLDTTTKLAVSGVQLDSAGKLTGYLEFAYDGANHRTLEKLTDTLQNVLLMKEWGYTWEGDLGTYFLTDNETPANTCQYYYSQYYIEQKYTLTTGQAYNGTSTNRLLKTQVRFNNTQGNILYSFAYTFDEFNRVSTEKAYDHNNVLKYTNTYTYN